MTTKLIPQDVIQSKILFFRGTKVMLDSDLALLYGVPTFRLNEALKGGELRPSDGNYRDKLRVFIACIEPCFD